MERYSLMANLIQRKADKEKALKIELPDGTEGKIPIEDDVAKTELMNANTAGDFKPYDDGGIVKKSSKGKGQYAHSSIDKLMKSSK